MSWFDPRSKGTEPSRGRTQLEDGATYQHGLTSALHAIEPQKERRGITVGTGVPLGMDAQALQ